MHLELLNNISFQEKLTFSIMLVLLFLDDFRFPAAITDESEDETGESERITTQSQCLKQSWLTMKCWGNVKLHIIHLSRQRNLSLIKFVWRIIPRRGGTAFPFADCSRNFGKCNSPFWPYDIIVKDAYDMKFSSTFQAVHKPVETIKYSDSVIWTKIKKLLLLNDAIRNIHSQEWVWLVEQITEDVLWGW